MLNLAQLLAREMPPQPKSAPRTVRPMGADLGDGEVHYTCIECGSIGHAENFYWRLRKSGKLARLTRCKTCHMRQSEAAAKLRRAAIKGGK